MSLAPAPHQTAWVVAAEMGLGHLRAAYPLKETSDNRILIAGASECSSGKETRLWKRMRKMYEGISRLNHIPVIGAVLFGLLEKLEHITPYYPFRDLSAPTFQVKYLDGLIKKGLGETLIGKIRRSKLPLVSTFFAVALAADHFEYPRVYLIATDSDLNRVWVAKDPVKSKVIYFAPCGHVVRRLNEYGVPNDRILLTGFPLPKENLGSPDLEILKLDLAQRLIYLDPNRHFWALHQVEVEHYLGPENCVNRSNRVLTLTYAVGGAGAQKEIGIDILNSLKGAIQNRRIRLNLVAGIRKEIHDYYRAAVKRLGLEEELGTGINILYAPTHDQYFKKFNLLLRTTDILWTKPSELSFYCALGIPLIMSPPLGAHEYYNRKWVIDHRAGFHQDEPIHCSEWLFDMLNEGRFAQAAWDGFLNTRKCGVFKIEEVLRTGKMPEQDLSPLKR